jgi:hypothetical protein
MSRRGWAGLVLGCLVSCAPPEPKQAGQVAEFTVLPVVMPTIGALDFSVRAGRIAGTIKLDQTFDHAVRVALVWIEPQGSGDPRLLTEGQQQLGSFDGTAGVHPFEAQLVNAPDAATGPWEMACGRWSDGYASVIVYVDLDDDGQLAVGKAAAVDHVLTSSDFPFELLQMNVPKQLVTFWWRCSEATFRQLDAHLPLVDSRSLDLVTCPSLARWSDAFYPPTVCGITPRLPNLKFSGKLTDDLGEITLYNSSLMNVFVDGVPARKPSQPTDFHTASTALALGQHHLRVESDGMAWEATFTFPDRTWIKAARRVRDDFEVHFQEVNGALRYALSIDERTERGTSSPILFRGLSPPGGTTLNLAVQFENIPFSCYSSEVLPE